MAYSTLLGIIVALAFLAVFLGISSEVSDYQDIIVTGSKYQIKDITHIVDADGEHFKVSFDEVMKDEDKEILSMRFEYLNEKRKERAIPIELGACDSGGNEMVCTIPSSYEIKNQINKMTSITTILYYEGYGCESMSIGDMMSDDDCLEAVLDTHIFYVFPEVIEMGDDWSFTREQMSKILEGVVSKNTEQTVKGKFDPREVTGESPRFLKITDVRGEEIKYEVSKAGKPSVEEWIEFSDDCDFQVIEFREDCEECDTDTAKYNACDADRVWNDLYEECEQESQKEKVECDFCEEISGKYYGCYLCQFYCECGTSLWSSWMDPKLCEDPGTAYAENEIICDSCDGSKYYSFKLDTGSGECTIHQA